MTMPSPSPVPLSDEAIDRYKTGAEHKKLIGEQIATVWTDDLLALIAELRALRSSPPSMGDGERAQAWVHSHITYDDGTAWQQQAYADAESLAREFQAVREDEREACAKVADERGAAVN